MRLYVIGGEGQVARSLREAAARDRMIVFRFSARSEVDLLLPSSVNRALADFRPDLVINPAAYTAVDQAESEPERAFAINRDGARVVAAAAAENGAPIIHFSTDYVFDGKKVRPMLKMILLPLRECTANPSSMANWRSPKPIRGMSWSGHLGSTRLLAATSSGRYFGWRPSEIGSG